MRSYFLSASVAVLALGISFAVQAETKLIYNQDTGAQVELDEATDQVVGTRNPAPEDNGYAAERADVDSEADAGIESSAELHAGDAPDEPVLESGADVDAGTSADTSAGNIQELDDSTNAGVRASATTKVDVR